MYGVKYRVPFKTISDRDSVVTLEERGYTGSVIELTAGGTPFIIDTDQSDLLTPIRSSTATLAVVGSDYLQDIYANDPQGIRVKCEVDGEVKWLGYLLPDTFSQDFTHPEFEYDMDLVAALSTLRYREFDLTDDFVTFRQIIEKAIEYSGYKVAYLTNSVKTENGKFYDLRISSANFFDELGEASTYYEALEEIAKYIGCCWVPHEDDLYLLDYQAIRSGYNSYTMLNGATATNITLGDAKVVDNYKGTGAKISRIAGKNKATVNCSLYEIKDLLPKFDDEQTTFVDMLSHTGRVNGVEHERILRSYSSGKFTFYKYLGGDVIENGFPVTFYDTIILTDLGAGFVKTAYYSVDQKPSRLNMIDEVMVQRLSDFSNQELTPNDKVFKMVSERNITTHPNVHFCINLQIGTLDRLNPYTADGKVGSTVYESVKFDSDGFSDLKLMFKLGDYYYNGTGWQTSETTFTVQIPYKKDSKILNEYRGLDNTNTYDTGLGELNGFIIKAPDEIVFGKCEVTFYDFKISNRVKSKYVFIKDIVFEYAIPDLNNIYGDWVDKDSKNDLIYENIIDEGYIDEAEEIDLKICTNTEGKLAFSSVLEGDNFLSIIRTDAFGAGIAEEILIQRVVSLFSKPRFVIDPVLENNAKPYTVFTEPHLDKKFMVAGGEEDVKMEITKYNLIEI